MLHSFQRPSLGVGCVSREGPKSPLIPDSPSKLLSLPWVLSRPRKSVAPPLALALPRPTSPSKEQPDPPPLPRPHPRTEDPPQGLRFHPDPDPTLFPRPSLMLKTCVARLWAMLWWQLLARVTVSTSPCPRCEPAALAPGSPMLQAVAAAAVAVGTAPSRHWLSISVPSLDQEQEAT